MQERNSRNLLCQWCDVPGADHCIIGTGHGYACTAKSIDESSGGIVDASVFIQVSTFEGREKNLADIVLQVIVNSNMEKVREWKGGERIMCEALRVLMADELNEERMEGQREGRIEGQREGQREGQIRAYASLVQDGIIPVETGAEKAGMSVDDFTKEMKQAGYVIPVV